MPRSLRLVGWRDRRLIRGYLDILAIEPPEIRSKSQLFKVRILKVCKIKVVNNKTVILLLHKP